LLLPGRWATVARMESKVIRPKPMPNMRRVKSLRDISPRANLASNPLTRDLPVSEDEAKLHFDATVARLRPARGGRAAAAAEAEALGERVRLSEEGRTQVPDGRPEAHVVEQIVGQEGDHEIVRPVGQRAR